MLCSFLLFCHPPVSHQHIHTYTLHTAILSDVILMRSERLSIKNISIIEIMHEVSRYYPFDSDDITNVLHWYNIILPLLSFSCSSFHLDVFVRAFFRVIIIIIIIHQCCRRRRRRHIHILYILYRFIYFQRKRRTFQNVKQFKKNIVQRWRPLYMQHLYTFRLYVVAAVAAGLLHIPIGIPVSRRMVPHTIQQWFHSIQLMMTTMTMMILD